MKSISNAPKMYKKSSPISLIVCHRFSPSCNFGENYNIFRTEMVTWLKSMQCSIITISNLAYTSMYKKCISSMYKDGGWGSARSCIHAQDTRCLAWNIALIWATKLYVQLYVNMYFIRKFRNDGQPLKTHKVSKY